MEARDSALEVFGQPVDGGWMREDPRHAISETPRDVSVRINVFSFDTGGIWSGEAVEPDILIRVNPPIPSDPTPIRVQPVTFQRFLLHLKNVATMGLAYYTRQACQAGCDDALFVDGDRFVSEGSVWNFAFFDGHDIVWPAAPTLPGIAKLVAQQALTLPGMPHRTEPIHISGVGSFQAAALMNSIDAGQPIAVIDGVHFSQEQNDTLVQLLQRAQEAAPMGPI